MAEPIEESRLKPIHEDVMSIAKPDGLQNVKFPNRDASFVGNGVLFNQLDGGGQRVMEQQQQMHIKEPLKELQLPKGLMSLN